MKGRGIKTRVPFGGWSCGLAWLCAVSVMAADSPPLRVPSSIRSRLLADERTEYVITDVTYDPALFRFVAEIELPTVPGIEPPRWHCYYLPIRFDGKPGGVVDFALITLGMDKEQRFARMAFSLSRWGRTFHLWQRSPVVRVSAKERDEALGARKRADPLRIAPGRSGSVDLAADNARVGVSTNYTLVARDEAGHLVWDMPGMAIDATAIFADDLSHDGRDEIIVIARRSDNKTVLRVFSGDPTLGPRE